MLVLLVEPQPGVCFSCRKYPIDLILYYRKHLIVAIGAECYVTLPKGQIIPTQPAGDHVDIPGGGHVLIVPITHYPTFSTIPPDLAAAIIDETEQCVSVLLSKISDTDNLGLTGLRKAFANSMANTAVYLLPLKSPGCLPRVAMHTYR